MLPKTAVDKESVDQKELVNVTLDFTWRIVQVSLKICIFWPTLRKIAIEKTVSFREKVELVSWIAEGQEIFYENNSEQQGNYIFFK